MAAEDETHAGGRAHSEQDGRRPTAAPPGARPEFLSLRSGLTIRQYVIEEVIGAGGFGITYRARHERLQAKVFALKEYFPREYAARSGTHVVSKPDGGGTFRWGLERFLKEAEALAKCEHPGIVDVVDYFEENGTAYAVLGYIDGQQLGQWLDSLGRAPTQAELDQVLMPLLDALDVVHAAKLLHLDIAPDNILIRRDGSPCLIDFGACREDIRGRTGKVSAIVKHGYSPPEQYHGLAELQGPWTDIYATGATLYRAISGALPMDSARRGALGDQLQPMGAMARSDYRPAFLAAIDMALRLKPEERPQSVTAWRKMLTAAEPAPAVARPEAPGRPHTPSTAPATLISGSGSRSTATAAPKGLRKPVLIGAIALALLGSMSAVALWRAPEPVRPTAALQQPVSPAATAAPDTSAVTARPPQTTPAPAANAPPTPRPAASAAPSPVPAAPRPATSPPQAAAPSAAVAIPPPAVPVAPRSDPEREAATAWAPIAQSNDVRQIEQFLARHGASAVAEQARTRLAVLGLEAGRVREREADFAACLGPAGALDDAACSRVIDSDDAPARRATALHFRGISERSRNAHDKAIADFGQSLALVANQPDVLNDRGTAHLLRGDGAAAIRDYGEAIRLDPRHGDALNNRAWAVLQAGRAADALPDADRAVELAPGKAYVFDTRGHIFEALSRRDDAIRDYERALALDPTQEDSRKALDRLKPRR